MVYAIYKMFIRFLKCLRVILEDLRAILKDLRAILKDLRAIFEGFRVISHLLETNLFFQIKNPLFLTNRGFS
jgi:hypothetical protein